jgi:hypothetical protein
LPRAEHEPGPCQRLLSSVPSAPKPHGTRVTTDLEHARGLPNLRSYKTTDSLRACATQPSRSADFAPRTPRGSERQWLQGSEVYRGDRAGGGRTSLQSRRTSLRAGSAPQVLARSRTASQDKEAGHGPEAARASDMPSKPVWGRKLPGGFDSRPPPQRLTCGKRAKAAVEEPRSAPKPSLRRSIGIWVVWASTTLRPQASYLVVTRTSLAALMHVSYTRLSSSTGMVRTPAVWRSYSAKPG